MTSDKLLLAYYGDDFTGSTDALEFLTRAGAKTVLFIQPPTAAQLARYSDLKAIGVAGMSRAMSPEMMETELRPAFAALRDLGAAHVHYKVCSTFDSSPAIGSIGKAIDIGADVFRSVFIPLLVAAPALGRYSAFGNLFARMGIGSQGTIHRLDRHPSMSKHPVTPADESDLRLHLSRQTSKKIGLIDILQVAGQPAAMKEAVEKLIREETKIVLFDALYEEQLGGIGALLDGYAHRGTLFSVGSSGIEMALGNHWKANGILVDGNSWNDPGKATPLLVISGSCSPITEAQISWAVKHGFEEVALDTEAIAIKSDPGAGVSEAVDSTVNFMKTGKSVIVHTSRGTNDRRVVSTERIFAGRDQDQNTQRMLTARLYGTALGLVARAAIEKILIKRVVIAGGDTSGYAARAMGIEAVEMIAPLVVGAPLCQAHAPGSVVNGLEVNFKGGQVGPDNYFGIVLQGKL
jgi:uncharacterized protein YgbK (DUF1537 family)